jgi:phosphoglycerate dehydrogenase-like enzyme
MPQEPTAATPRVAVIDLNATSSASRLPPEGEARLRAATPEGWQLRFVRGLTVSDGDGQDRPSDEALAAIGDAEVYFGYGMSPPLLEAAPRLRWAQSASAGVRRLLFPAMLERDLLLTNAAGIYGPTMAETVLAGVMYFLRGLDVALARQREARWDKDPWQDPQRSDRPAMARELPECRVLVIGAGGIGREVGQRFSALGAHCVGVRRRPELGVPEGFAAVTGPEGVDRELEAADVVVVAAPSTQATERVLDARRLALLPPRAIVVNVARGALLDEGALVAALSAGRLRGAVLDVFDEEPLPPDSPIWGLPNVLVTPHVSGISPALFWHRMLDLFVANWERYRRGEPLVNLVDKVAGY